MKYVIVTFVVALAVYLAGVHLGHEVLLDGYFQGCRDTMNQLYKDSGLKEVDQNSLNSYCEQLAYRYVKSK